ncbi:hypothetical protein L1987_18526 [Smallanthus sonchifolius]|uniref:Uncharacterized protein n=1 Tax=Smallanthus sonchifolius TaxID=185202 RepID=A0ACB9J220_9ASTR|nr:hypothetical protein L1987_18526 [Smallanthus sonchifolius]
MIVPNKHPNFTIFISDYCPSHIPGGERLQITQNPNQMDRSSRKHRDSDRDRDTDSTKDYKHRSSKHTDDHHRSKHDKHRDTDGDDRRRRSERERSEDVEDRFKRERSYDREGSKDTESREKSVDNRRHHKRKDRAYSDDEDRYNEARDKRVKVLDERKERRKFEDRVKEEVDFVDNDGGKLHQRDLNGETMRTMKREPEDESFGGSNANGGAPGSCSKEYGISRETPLAPSHPPPKMEILQGARVGASL